jgi:O-antigen ligase
MLNINEKKFYTPKIVVCVFVWLYLVAETWLNIRLVGTIVLLAYLIYFAVVSYLVSKAIGLMKKSYKWLICATLGVVGISLVILFLNG